MSERQSLRLKIPSEKLALIQQSMDGVKKKRKTRVNWKAGEKEAMVAFREKYSEMPMKEFQQTYYPDRSVKSLRMVISNLRKKELGKEAETGTEDRRRSNTPRLTRLKRPRKSGPFEFSDSSDEDSSSDERIEDINPSGRRTPNKFIKLSHSAEAQSPPARHAEQREAIVRSQTDEALQIPKETTALSSRPQTTPPETVNVVQDTSRSESSPSSTGMSTVLLNISLEQPAECPRSELQVAVLQDEPQQKTQLQTPKQVALLESSIRQEFAKEITNIYARLQSLCRFEEQLFSVASETRAHNSVLEKTNEIMKGDYDMMKKEIDAMKNEKDMEIAQLKESLKVEKQTNAHLAKRFEMMKDVFEGKFEA